MVGQVDHRGPYLRGLALDAFRRFHVVGGEVGGEVLGVGGPAATRRTDIGLGHLAPVVDAHQPVCHPDFRLGPGWQMDAGIE